jgi:hypothetical protein
VLEGTTKDEVKLVAIGYRYSRKTILHFILTKNSGKTEAGTPYEMKYTDTYGNVCVRGVERLDVIYKFFQTSNIIDTHNYAWKLSGGQEVHTFVWLLVQCTGCPDWVCPHVGIPGTLAAR